VLKNNSPALANIINVHFRKHQALNALKYMQANVKLEKIATLIANFHLQEKKQKKFKKNRFLKYKACFLLNNKPI